MATAKSKLQIVDPVSNGGEDTIDLSRPYAAQIEIMGTADILFHAWNCEAVEEKGKAAKGSKAKKTDDLESYVYRTEEGNLAIPGSYLRGAIVNAAKFRQDPRSPRKSAMDLFKAGVVALTPLASFGVSEWDYVSKMRVTVQRAGITRSRPALRTGWKATFIMQVLLPEYISDTLLKEVLEDAGRLVGVGDFRPTYGRFSVSGFQILSD
jgi:hypothetical protein